MSEVSMLIGGKDVGASNGAIYERLNPVTGELASRAPAATPDDADAAVESGEASSYSSQTEDSGTLASDEALAALREKLAGR